MKSVTEKVDFYTNAYTTTTQDQQFVDELRTIEDKHIISVEDQMPDRRVRPSLLTPVGDALGLAQSAATLLLGKQYANIVFQAAEKGIQDEIDEQLRILNERGIREDEVRKQIIEMRDQTYDMFEKSGNKVDVEGMKKRGEIGYYLYLLGTYSTTAAMRIGRKL
ncbi:hypothetical protein FGO68_gene5374 [Halteria grandinella]|uniref:Uncharacterized protein n=1 Tax=Halteria grandinella TaxID=5974 RepID=A0A8J8NJV5_HALGN|nr:hypothetical protein FGO68_gene5374 [Halteria grandinella]